MRIVAFTGNKGCGKDTASDIVRNLLKSKDNIKAFSLSNKMKMVAKELFIWGNHHTNGNLKETIDPDWGISPRVFLQEFGTYMREELPTILPEFGKRVRNDFWCITLHREIDKYCIDKKDPIILINDIRLPTEIDYFRRISDDCCLIRIKRDAKIYGEDSHPTETSFDQLHPDFVIDNNGTLEELEEKTKTILRILGVL